MAEGVTSFRAGPDGPVGRIGNPSCQSVPKEAGLQGLEMKEPCSPLRHILTGAGVRVATIGVSGVIGFLLTPFMMRVLGDRDYGIMVLVGTFTGWFGLLDFGLADAVSRYVTVHFAQRDYESCNGYANSSFFLYLRLGAAAFVVALAAAAVCPFVMTDPRDRWMVPLLLALGAWCLPWTCRSAPWRESSTGACGRVGPPCSSWSAAC